MAPHTLLDLEGAFDGGGNKDLGHPLSHRSRALSAYAITCRTTGTRKRENYRRRHECGGLREVLDISTAAVSSRDKFDWFCDTVSSGLMPASPSTRHATDFRAKITDLDLGAVRLSIFAFSPVLSRRTAAHVRRGDPEQYQLALVAHGAFGISQAGHESVIAGDLLLTHTSPPDGKRRGLRRQAGRGCRAAESPVLPCHCAPTRWTAS